ncbi:uncharacterized protein LOC142981476 [Anticarsia gemmatalis]|uniref:uncharacterized protein LOC142981476 n=1 Tax=Anticarsia gemmatalis TaxID=129554 RepID=UPI003F75C4A4
MPHLSALFNKNHTTTSTAKAMYRTATALMVCLCTSTVLAAPQNTNITNVKQQADTTIPQDPTQSTREDILPLTIPASTATAKETSKQPDTTKPSSSPPKYNYSDRIYSIKTKPKITTTTTSAPTETITVKVVNDSDTTSEIIAPSESKQTDTRATENSTLVYETTATENDVEVDFVTEKYEGELTVQTVVDEETTKAPTARFLPKLSHFGKTGYDSFSQNLIGPSSKRRFRSRCRCERIWNCAKLQISVPRCPEEYFMCCS